jgi:hypothetical protein
MCVSSPCRQQGGAGEWPKKTTMPSHLKEHVRVRMEKTGESTDPSGGTWRVSTTRVIQHIKAPRAAVHGDRHAARRPTWESILVGSLRDDIVPPRGRRATSAGCGRCSFASRPRSACPDPRRRPSLPRVPMLAPGLPWTRPSPSLLPVTRTCCSCRSTSAPRVEQEEARLDPCQRRPLAGCRLSRTPVVVVPSLLWP